LKDCIQLSALTDPKLSDVIMIALNTVTVSWADWLHVTQHTHQVAVHTSGLSLPVLNVSLRVRGIVPIFHWLHICVRKSWIRHSWPILLSTSPPKNQAMRHTWWVSDFAQNLYTSWLVHMVIIRKQIACSDDGCHGNGRFLNFPSNQ
jgi:hypothetical protein